MTLNLVPQSTARFSVCQPKKTIKRREKNLSITGSEGTPRAVLIDTWARPGCEIMAAVGRGKYEGD